MTPSEALSACTPAAFASPAARVTAAALREKIIGTTAAAGQRNLEAVRRERVKRLPDLSVGEAVLLGAAGARRRHSVTTTRCVHAALDRSCFRLRACAVCSCA
jgi:hypothetical protein